MAEVMTASHANGGNSRDPVFSHRGPYFHSFSVADSGENRARNRGRCSGVIDSIQ